MAMQSRSIFATIVTGAAALVIGSVYLLGETETSAPLPVTEAAIAAATTPEISAPVAVATPQPAPAPRPARPAAAEARRITTLHAHEALAAYRSTFLERCWTPSPESGPDHIDLRFNLAFDPKGTLVGVGISESRKAFRADVSACLRGLSVKFTVPPPGAPVQVQVPITLP